MRASEQIQTEIQDTLGFVPPFFAPATQNPQVFEYLWQQSLLAYILNPFSSLFKEKLSAYLSRYCKVPYCLVCHSCSLSGLGMNGKEVLQLLESPPPSLREIDHHITLLTARQSELNALSQLNLVLEESLLRCAIFISVHQNLAQNCQNKLRSLLGFENYQHLVAFIAYIRTCHTWMEAHPEVSYQDDQRTIDYLATLLTEEPSLAKFFNNYVEKVNRERLIRSCQIQDNIEQQATQSQVITGDLQLAQAINSASVGIIITDPSQPDNPIIYSNPAFSSITGYQQEEILGRNCRFLRGTNTDRETVELIRKGIASATEVKATLLNYRKDGTPFWNELKISPVFSDAGELIYFVGFQIDITEKKQLEAQLLRAQRLESVENLASGMAHGLNNALTPVSLAVQLLEIKIQDEQSRNLLKILKTNIQRSANLIKEVLSFVRGVEGELILLQVEHLIEEIKQILQNTFPQSIAIQTHISNLNSWAILGNATQLHQVLLNLCINAKDAMPNGGTLSITTEKVLIEANPKRINFDAKEGNYLVITVADTGVGIAPQILNKIFDPFFTTKEIGKGTGIGLAIVQGILKNHGGFVNVHSELGVGTQFQVYLPAVKVNQELSHRKVEEPGKPLVGQGELILLVDDEESILVIAKDVLLTHNYQVLTANNGAKAVELYAQHYQEISVVLMDMQMPLTDAKNAIFAMQKINPQVKVIASSGFVSSQNLRQVPGKNIKGFLTKPYSVEQLLKTLQGILKATNREEG